MVDKGIGMDNFTFTFSITACTRMLALQLGQSCHGFALKLGFDLDIFVSNSLINLYACCREVDSRGGFLMVGLALIRIQRGKQIHASIERLGVEPSVHLSTAFDNMYAKCGNLEFVHKLCNEIPDRNVVSWSTMIAGYAYSDQCKEALDLFCEMQANVVAPNEGILVTVLSVSANLGAFDQGNGNIGTALIHIYAKCARLEVSFEVFNTMPDKNMDSWNAIISVLAMHALGAKAMDCFYNMKSSGIQPDDITFIGILSACSHSGLYNITPKIEHYGFMVDLLGHVGLLLEAQQLIESMRMKPDTIVWGVLGGACKLHGELELGKKIVNRVLELEPRYVATYVLISNIYAGAGRWGQVKKILLGWSSIEIEGIVHQFLVGDRSHSRSKEIYAMLEKIIRRLRLEGHSPDTKNVLHDVGEEEKEDALHYHSQKLAIAFGLIATRSWDKIYVVKNHHICGDCNSTMKTISRIFDREIIVRDRVRLHHFIDGSCSCMDYW
ncbi:hypothetical protein AMTRI_Chr08g208260 [Amborella trichopoda]